MLRLYFTEQLEFNLANAMQTSAGVFEALSEVDTKFAKVADKEYDAISSEVKKWFKKLAVSQTIFAVRLLTSDRKKRRCMTTNCPLLTPRLSKQVSIGDTLYASLTLAGMAYEKKSKRKTLDATEEHTRYMNLISTLGPEVTQEK